jgi:aryl-alcohol dehydrogenase-like predicted oxidoreductase
MFKFGRVNRVVYDYTESGALTSIEGSLNRLGVDRVDFVFVHDPAQDFHGDAWLAQLETARTGAFRALTGLREQGVIKGWGLHSRPTDYRPAATQKVLMESTPSPRSMSVMVCLIAARAVVGR